MNKINRILTALMVGAMLAGLVWAGTSNLDRLTLQPEAASGDTFVINNSSGTEVFSVDYLGVMDVGGSSSTFAGIVLDTNTDLVGAADGTSDLGASGTEIGTAWVQTIDDGDGTVTVAANLDTSGGTVALGSNVPTMTTSRTAFIFFAPDGAVQSLTQEAKNDKWTTQFADVSADTTIDLVWWLPDDFAKGTSHVDVHVHYLCDDATVTEGEWDIQYLAGNSDTDADAALGNELTVLDTPVQNQWMRTGAMSIPFGNIGASDDWLAIKVYHDVSDPLCNAAVVNGLGVELVYTTDTNY